MKEFIEKLIERLGEEYKCSEEEMLNSQSEYAQEVFGIQMNAYEKTIRIVNQLAEEYVPDMNVGCKNKEVQCEEKMPEEKSKFSNEKLDAIMDKILDNQDLNKVSQEPKKRIERIRTMSVEEVADAILERSEISTAIDFCQNFEQCYENVPEEKCRECLIKYLNSLVEQKKVIPTDYYMERFTEVI